MQQLSRIKGGQILFLSDFRGAGADSAIKMSLSRIAGAGDLRRLSHGIYMKPKANTTEKHTPPAEDIASAIARREKIRIKPSGTYALYKLGFNNDPPSVFTYVTDGEPRNIKIGEHTIIFKATTPKKLSMNGPISSLIIQALEEIGKTNITADLEQKIKTALAKENPKHLKEDMQKAQAWIYNLLIRLKSEN
ncbi:MAG TPA: DUF6088 family protein [Candidatus Babeliaceae bacterium]|nr:DUF6088 family protein [Candidatus Babeliaceae bacterium]